MPDYIEREAALDALCKASVPCFSVTGKPILDVDYVPAINAIPAADVRPVVRAHWYWDRDGMDWGIGAWRCSACNAMSPMWWNTDRGSPMHKSGHKFCPNCGADMREES